jgi:2'-5' RNA ligase
MIRLFVAISLPAGHRRRLAGLCHGVREVRWVAAENLHLSLRFIGEVEEPQASDIAAALGGVRCDPFPLTLAGVGHFESGRRVRVLWAGVESCGWLATLQERVESALRRAGVSPDSRRFTPHVSLARIKAAPPQRVGGWLEANSLFRVEPFMVDRFILYESFLAHTGAIYSPVEVFMLTADQRVRLGG